MNRNYAYLRSGIAYSLALIFLLFSVNIAVKISAQSRAKRELAQEEQNFHRPKPVKPVTPVVPGANRYQEDKIFLEYADSLYKIDDRDTVIRQILKGNVKFRQAGMWMYCDSAYYYPDLNSLDAFGNVRMEQGDTLFVYSDKLFYEGNERFARLKNGPSQEKVILINNDVTLTTDSLDYDLAIELGWYSRWGTIDDKVNTLTSLFGEYSPATKEADFYKDVVLVNNQDGYVLVTDTLHYNTETHIANIESPTEIQSENDTIITTKAIYDTNSGNAELLSRSTIIHKDSTGNIATLEGDSIVYDKASHISRAYMFRDPWKRSMPMVLTDTAQKMKLIGGYGIYNDSTREALATVYPLLMEYSQNDTLFLRADTIKTFIVTEWVESKKRKTKSGYPESEGKPIVIYDSLGIWIDTVFFSPRLYDVEKPIQMIKSEFPPEKKKEEPSQVRISSQQKEGFSRDSIASLLPQDSINSLLSNDSLNNNDSLIILNDSLNVLNKDLRINLDNAEMQLDSVLSGSIDTLRNQEGDLQLMEQEEESLSEVEDTEPEIEDDVERIPQDFHVALAYHRGRFFKSDMQGVADSIVFVEMDSMMYLFRKPIVWSGERQVTGNRIDVHFNDSTVDWTLLPESGMISEYIDEDFYNQIAGKTIYATFEDQDMKSLEVSGNVETIFLPQESDSTYNRLVYAESSFMTMEMEKGQLDKLKMWPEVNGTVTPIFMVKNNQKYLQKFRWWASLRPEREWYGDQMRWADNLGEVSDELELYFTTPSDFGEPKSFSGTRFEAPPTSLPVWDDAEAIEEENLTLSDIEENEEEMKLEDEEITEHMEEIREEVETEEGFLEDENKKDSTKNTIMESFSETSEEAVTKESEEINESAVETPVNQEELEIIEEIIQTAPAIEEEPGNSSGLKENE